MFFTNINDSSYTTHKDHLEKCIKVCPNTTFINLINSDLPLWIFLGSHLKPSRLDIPWTMHWIGSLGLPSNILAFQFNHILQAIINETALIFFTYGLLHHLFNSSSNVFPPQTVPLILVLDSTSFQTWLVNVQNIKSWEICSSLALQSVHQLGPCLPLFCKLFQVRTFVSSARHIDLCALSEHLKF